MEKDFLSPENMDWRGDFDLQVKNLMDYVRLTRDVVNGLSNLFEDLKKSLQKVWHGCQVMPFGSIVTGLGIKSSDVDCYVRVPKHYGHNQPNFVIQARNVLRKQRWLFQQVFAITTAKVPIVKMYHIPTNRQCDVSFKSISGVRNSQLIACLLRMDERVLLFSVLIKYWAKVHCLAGTNLLTNYALIVMVIFYMQQKNILPTVLLLQQIKSGKFYVDNWDTAFSDNYQHNTDNNQSLYELLGEFFIFYNTFEFNKFVISPFIGKSVPRQHFENLKDIPKEFNLYKTYKNDEGFASLVIDKPMCVQDVFEHNRNCAVAVFPRLLTRLILHFKWAADMYAKCDAKNFLKEILIKKPFTQKHLNNKQENPNISKPIKRKISNDPGNLPAPKRNRSDDAEIPAVQNSTFNTPLSAQATQQQQQPMIVPKKTSLNLVNLYHRGRKHK